MFVFEEKEWTGVSGEKPLEAAFKNQQETQARYGFDPHHIGGRRMLSPPRHSYSVPLPTPPPDKSKA